MKRVSVIGVVLAASLSVFMLAGAMTASAAGPTKTSTVDVSLRVSPDCKVTITGRWSNLPESPLGVQNQLWYDGSVYDWMDSSATATHGVYKTVWQGTPSTTLHSIGAVTVAVTVQASDPVSVDAYCAAPFDRVSG